MGSTYINHFCTLSQHTDQARDRVVQLLCQIGGVAYLTVLSV